MAETDVMNIFKKLTLAESSAVSIGNKEEDYVLDVTAQTGLTDCTMAATSTNHTIQLFSQSTLASRGAITGHENVISSIRFGKSEQDLLISSSLDRSIRCWDLRTDRKKAVQTLQGSAETNNLFTSVDMNASDRVVCAGMEAEKDGDTHLLFWDRRGPELLGCYSESHTDDITQVCFHPTNPDRLATGSTDGLVCVFDISQTDEDDALLWTLNSCSTVAKVGWCGQDYTQIYCTTHINTAHIWDTDQGDPVLEITDVKESLKDDDAVEYLVDCLCTPASDTYVVAGKHNGDVHVLRVHKDGSLEVVHRLKSGHSSTVRCLHWNAQTETMVTGGEDSLLCLWSAAAKPSKSPANKAKLKSKKPVSKRTTPY